MYFITTSPKVVSDDKTGFLRKNSKGYLGEFLRQISKGYLG